NNQVSPSTWARLTPPNSTTRPLARSVAIAWFERGGGEVAGCRRVHAIPFQSQRSLTAPAAPKPPNSSTCWVTGSVARAEPEGVGGLAAATQSVPVHSKVPPGRSPAKPTATTRPRAPSTAVDSFPALTGDTLVWRARQAVPSCSKVAYPPPA